MRRSAPSFVLLLLLTLPGCHTPDGQLNDSRRDYTDASLAFEGAQGFGVDTPGGRGGEVIRVTSLDADGPGTLRAALAAEGPRVIVFEVGGVIDLRESLTIRTPFVTVAGQTAPSPGVTIIGAGIEIQTHDVVIRHLKIRPGDREEGPKPKNRDAITVLGSKGDETAAYNVVIDHNSLTWAIDEVASTWYPGVRDVTFSNNIIAEGLWESLHSEGQHSKGLLIGDHSKRVAVVRNVFAHNDDRNPVLKYDVSAIVVNNLVYNAGQFAMVLYGGKNCCPSLGTFVGNRFIAGPQSWDDTVALRLTSKTSKQSKVYVEDNGTYESHYGDENLVDEPPVWFEPIDVMPADEVEELLLERAGARPWDRDEIDERILREIRERSGSGPDTVEQAGGFPEHQPTMRALEVPAEPWADDDDDGITNLDEWLVAFQS